MPEDRDWIREIVEAWQINNRINIRLLEGIGKEGMQCTLSTRGGRNVVREFTHLQYVRVFQLTKRAKSLVSGVRTFQPKEEPGKRILVAALEDSSRRIDKWIRLAGKADPGVRTLRRGIVPTVAYLISHESHHRGRILLTLKVAGHAVAPGLRNGIWDWNKV